MISVVEFCVHALISGLLLPIILFLSFPLFLYRLFISVIIRIRYGSDVSIVDGRDMINGLDTPESPSIINVLMVFDGKPKFEKIRDSIQKLIDSGDFPKTRKYVSLLFGFWCWMPDKSPYDWKKHIKYFDKEVNTESELFQILDKIAFKSFPADTPMWEVIVIPKHDVENGEAFYLLVRIHHFMSDGVNLINTFLHFSGDEQFQLLPKTLKSPTLLQNIQSLMISVSFAFLSCWDYFRSIDKHALHGPKLCGEKIVAWSDPIDLKVVRNIRHETKTRVTDILIGSLAHAFSNYVQLYVKNGSKISKLHTVVTIAFPPDSKPEMKNKVSFLDFNLPISMNSNLQKEVTQKMNSLRHSPSFMTNYWLLGYLSFLYPNSIAKRLFRGDNYSILLSNVPGPTDTVRCFGNKLTDTMFWLPNRGFIGIGISLLSYQGHVRAALTVDKSVIRTRDEVDFILNQWVHHIKETGNVKLSNNNSKAVKFVDFAVKRLENEERKSKVRSVF